MGRRDECPGCQRDARVCLNCQFYDVQAYRQCREPQAEWVQEKDRGNFCGYFSAASSRQGRQDAATPARQKLDQLFGAASPSAPPDSPKDADKSSIAEDLARFLKSR